MTEPIRKLGRYELLRQVATGGMGEIYLARTRGAGGFEKHLIIKTILPHLAEQEEFVTKFLDEGRIVVQLTHGNIVPVFDMGEEDGEYFIAMEYVPGLDVRAILKRLSARGEQMPIEIALYITCELCKGLGYAHRKTDDDGQGLNIVHRDVSPSNVLVSREGEVKIIDFGIARAADKVAETKSGSIQGKCCYMSPEQARGKSLDARSDIFSTGVLLYEMLTGQRPFEGDSDLESLELVRQCDADAPGALRPAVPQQVDAIVERAMARDLDDRYQAIDDMFVDLQHELYRCAQPVTSQRLAEEFEEIFEAAQQEEGDEQRRRPPANLDEALELQLAEAEQGPSSDPAPGVAFAATAAADADGTQTLAPTPTPTTVDEGSQDSSTTTPPETPLDDASGSNDDEPDSRSYSSLGIELDEQRRLILRRRHIVATVAAALAIGAGVATVYLLQSPPEATLQLETEPSGAQVYVDGDQWAGTSTPASLELSPGEHRIELTLDDYRSRQFRVDLEAGETKTLESDDLTMTPEPQAQRQFTITTDPEDATILADGQRLGNSPADIELESGDVVNLSARAPGCSSLYYALSFRHERDEIHLPLDCDDDTEGEDDPEAPPEPAQLRAEGQLPEDIEARDGRATRQSIRIESSPSGADTIVDGDTVGQTPLYAELHPQREATIEVRHDGYEPFQTTTSGSEIDGQQMDIELEEQPQGCIDFRAVYPANNKIAINGEWLDGRHMTLRNHPLPAGDNRITVYHPQSEKRETFDVDIEPGDDCRVLTVWERD